MSFKTVHLNEKTIVGITARTSNSAPDMQAVIASLWQRFFEGGEAKRIKNAAAPIPIGLYSDYSQANTAKELEYDITVGFEVADGGDIPQGMTAKHIPAGDYAIFSAKGTSEAVAALWQEIWATPLNRRYSGDFELYGASGDQIEIYIALN